MLTRIPDDALLLALTWLDSGDLHYLSRTSKKIGNVVFEYKYRKLNLRRLTLTQQKMAKQVFVIIQKSHFSLGKRYFCLRALVGAISGYVPFPTAVSFSQIAIADIPHFILTRCWSIMMSPKARSNFSIFTYHHPVTKRSFAALLQAYKNTLQVIPKNLHSIPHVILTKGNKPVFKKENRTRDDDDVPYMQLKYLNIWQNQHHPPHAFKNIKIFDAEVREALIKQIALVVEKRLIGEDKLSIKAIITSFNLQSASHALE